MNEPRPKWRISIREALVAVLLASIWLGFARIGVDRPWVMLILVVVSVGALTALVIVGADRDASDFWGGMLRAALVVSATLAGACCLVGLVMFILLVISLNIEPPPNSRATQPNDQISN